MISPSGLMFGVAIVLVVAGVLLIAFPGVARKWSEAQQEYKIRQGRKSRQLKSDGSFRAVGVGLPVVAPLVAYYAHTTH